MRDPNHARPDAASAAGCTFLALVVIFVLALAHATFHAQYAETSVPDDRFVLTAATAESAAPKRVCLTFDDGPSKHTAEVLEILRDAGVPATFFVTAQPVNEPYLPLLRDAVAQGHQIAMHSATHDYARIYAGTDAFWQDIKQLRQVLEPYVPLETLTWLRFPGGSTNTVSHRYGGRDIMRQLKAQCEEKGYHWIDWNVCAEDATAAHPDADEILRNIKRDAKDNATCVVLLHDTRATGETVKALPHIIEYFKQEGAIFCTVAQLSDLQSGTG